MSGPNIQRFDAAGFYELSAKLHSLGVLFTTAPNFMDDTGWRAMEETTVKSIENQLQQLGYLQLSTAHCQRG